jgi:hypothetical protein
MDKARKNLFRLNVENLRRTFESIRMSLKLEYYWYVERGKAVGLCLIYCSTIPIPTTNFGCQSRALRQHHASRSLFPLISSPSSPLLGIVTDPDHVYNHATGHSQYSSPLELISPFHFVCRRALFSSFQPLRPESPGHGTFARANEPTHVLPFCRTLTPLSYF